MKKETNGNTLKYRVDQLEGCYKEIDKNVTEIMSNHLPHIREEILISRAAITDEINNLKLTVKENSTKVAILVSVLMTVLSIVLNKII